MKKKRTISNLAAKNTIFCGVDTPEPVYQPNIELLLGTNDQDNPLM